jgi:hypothetical protein
MKRKRFKPNRLYTATLSLCCAMLTACGGDGNNESNSNHNNISAQQINNQQNSTQPPPTVSSTKRRTSNNNLSNNFDNPSCAKLPNLNHSAIINPYYMTHAQTWRQFTLNEQRLLNALKCMGVNKIFVQMRQADDKNDRDPDFVPGSIYYDSAQPYSNGFITKSYDEFGLKYIETTDYNYFFSNQNNPKFQYIGAEHLIQTAQNQGFEVWAWLPIFNDPLMWQNGPESFKLKPISQNADEKMVSPANTEVRKWELQRILEIARRFNVKGIAVDWFRYTDDAQPIDSEAQSEFRNYLRKQGITNPPTNAAQARDQYRAHFTTFRENILNDFLVEIRNNLPSNIELGAFLLPHSAKKPGANTWTGSGVNLQRIIAMNKGLHIMPMVYSIKDWSDGYNDWRDYGQDVIQRVAGWTKQSNNTFSPVLSMSTSSQYALTTLTQYARSQGTQGVVYYFSGNWLAEGASQVENGNTDSGLQRLCEAGAGVTYGLANCREWPLLQPPLQ